MSVDIETFGQKPDKSVKCGVRVSEKQLWLDQLHFQYPESGLGLDAVDTRIEWNSIEQLQCSTTDVDE